MQALLDQMMKDGAFAGVPPQVVYAIGMVLTALVVLSVFVAPLAGVTSWLERRVWARMQSRVGPNRVGPQGILQWLADGIKNIMKEDIIPTAADQKLFPLAPYVVFMGFLCTFVVIPFGANLIVADLNIGILYLLAVTSLVVVGILMAGWASNNKWSLLGGMRSAAQIVSYEIPAGLSILTDRISRRHAEHAGHHQSARLGTVGLVHVPQSIYFLRVLSFFHRRSGGRQPHAVRYSRSRVRAGRRLRDRVQRHALLVFLLRRVGQSLRHRRGGDDAVPGRLAGAAGHRQSGAVGRCFSS